ncbi:MAG: hypothetical protein R3C14_15655 [Caldilineaceae bacterium]
MATVQTLTRRFERVFPSEQAVVLAETITEAYNDLVKTSDFNELKAIVKELAEAQIRTEVRLDDLTKDVQLLTQAQQRTEARLDDLTQAQQRTEARLDDLTQAQQRTEASVNDLAKDMQQLTRVVTGMAQEMGGLSRSMSYALENEAYRALPAFLQRKHDIIITDRIVRIDIGDEEINFFALGTRAGEPICLVGESKLQLDERRNSRREAKRVISQLANKVDAVREAYPDRDIVRLLVTHYARPGILQYLREHNVLVIQTFEW